NKSGPASSSARSGPRAASPPASTPERRYSLCHRHGIGDASGQFLRQFSKKREKGLTNIFSSLPDKMALGEKLTPSSVFDVATPGDNQVPERSCGARSGIDIRGETMKEASVDRVTWN